MSNKYSELLDTLVKLKLISQTGYGSVNIILKDYKINEITKSTHYLCKDEIITKEMETDK